MKRPPFSPADPTRKIQADSGRPIGFLQSIPEQLQRLASDIDGLDLRLHRRLTDGEPEAIVARKVFAPETGQVFNWDYLQDGISTTQAVYVVRDAVTHEIPIAFPPPGVFCARYLVLKMWQRTYDGTYAQLMPISFGNQMQRLLEDNDDGQHEWGQDQTPKFSIPLGIKGSPFGVSGLFSRRMNFFWNLIDLKSGAKLADYLMPDQMLLPQAMGSSRVDASGAGVQSFTPGRYQFRTPWLFERDGQATFHLRPITPILQPTASSSLATPFLESGQINMSVTVQVELHGTRYVTMRDALRMGANFGDEAVIR